jgi:outer membrane protein assembly factor BamB
LPLLLLLVAWPAVAADWPQWLGPQRDGSSTEKIKPWKGNLKVLWKEAVGAGHSSPVIAGGKVFLHTKVNAKEEEEVSAYDAKTGKKLWGTPYARERFFSPFGLGPQATPAVANDKVYTFGATGVLACCDVTSGKLVWQVDTRKTFNVDDKRRLFFGSASSPLLDDKHVLVNVGGQNASVVAFEKDTGKTAWKALDDRASYSSGIVIGQGKDRQIVFLTQAGLRSLVPADGKTLWEFPLADKLNESATTPVLVGDVLLGSSVTYGMVGLQLGEKGGKPTATQLWYNKALTCYFSTPIPVGKEHVYVVTGGISFLDPSSTLRCVEVKTGKELWNQPKVGKYHAAMLRTGDNKLLMLSDVGDLVLIDPSPKGYKELARSKVGNSDKVWAHPALSDGRVYLRDEKELICLELP